MKLKLKGAKPALFLDLDNTVRYVDDPSIPCPNKPSDIKIYPKVIEKINNFKKAGFYIFGVSNQGGIEKGYLTEENCELLMSTTNTLMDNSFDKIVWASKLISEDRKPNPGMINKLALEYNIDLEASIMVGDKDSDLMCSLNAGIKEFFYAKDFFIEGHRAVAETLKKQQEEKKPTYLELIFDLMR